MIIATTSWSGWWLGPCIVFMVVCMLLMGRMMSHGMRHGSHGSAMDEWHWHRSDEAKRILGERLARGEIDTEEYQRLLGAIQQTREPHGT